MKTLSVHLGDDEAGCQDATVLGKLLSEVLNGGCGLYADAKLNLSQRRGERERDS